MSIVSTYNAKEVGVGVCYVCNDMDVETLLVDCGHWACEGCIYTVFKDGPVTVQFSRCDRCDPPEGFE